MHINFFAESFFDFDQSSAGGACKVTRTTKSKPKKRNEVQAVEMLQIISQFAQKFLAKLKRI